MAHVSVWLSLLGAAATEESTSSPLDSPPSTPPPEKEQQESVGGNAVGSGDSSSSNENSSAGGNVHDALMQLRVWKERSARMEMLLAKKSAKIQEMEETVRQWRVVLCAAH